MTKDYKRRLNVYLPGKLYDKVQKYSDDNSLSITSAVIVLLNQALNNNLGFEILEKNSSLGIINQDAVEALKNISNLDNDEIRRMNDLLEQIIQEKPELLNDVIETDN